MPEMVICKPCGYVMNRDRLRGVCPACGASSSVFKPYEDKVSASRRRILDLDLHPILVHAPQAFATFLPGLTALAILFPPFYPEEVAAVVCFMALILPISVIGAISSGLIDAKLKFKKLSPPLVVRKIVLGVGLLLVSLAIGLVVLLGGFSSDTRLAVAALSGASLLFAILLGHCGKQLIRPILPGR